MSLNVYHWCLVPECTNTSTKTPQKLWIQLPSDIKMRNTWLKLARRDPRSLSKKTRLYFCEDHFDLKNDMENYTQYKIMGSVKRIKMKPNCLPSRFDCQPERKQKLTPSAPRQAFVKRQRMSAIKEIEQTIQNENYVTSLPSCSQDILIPEIEKCADKAVDKYNSDESHIPSVAGSMTDYDSSLYKISSQSTITSDEKFKKVEKVNLPNTLSKIKNNPSLYIGLSKELYFLIDLINDSEQNILLCLMRIKLNRTFAELADDFDLSVNQTRNVFFDTMPEIVKVLSRFIKQFSTNTIKRNLPIAFRRKYNNVTCIIDCMEIEIQKPKAIYQALTWSDYIKTNTIKYLISCTPDGLVNFVSTGYAGRISDVNILEHSKFLDRLPPNACILANRGFKHLKQLLTQKGFTLLRPPSVSAGSKLNERQVWQTKQITSLRIHIERVIPRLREFGILKMHPEINEIGMLDLCVTTACALINLQDKEEELFNKC